MVDRIAIDAMGGDFGPSETGPAAIHVLARHPNLQLTLVGQQDRLQEELRKFGQSESERLQILHAPEVVEMHELPSLALRNKKQS